MIKTEHCEIATGSNLPTMFILEGDGSLNDYRIYGYIRVSDKQYCNYSSSYRRRLSLRSSSFYIKWPKQLGDIWPLGLCHLDNGKHYQMYAGPIGHIRVDWSIESILIELRDIESDTERDWFFTILKRAGWEPEIVGDNKFIRCPVSKIEKTRNRFVYD